MKPSEIEIGKIYRHRSHPGILYLGCFNQNFHNVARNGEANQLVIIGYDGTMSHWHGMGISVVYTPDDLSNQRFWGGFYLSAKVPVKLAVESSTPAPTISNNKSDVKDASNISFNNGNCIYVIRNGKLCSGVVIKVEPNVITYVIFGVWQTFTAKPNELMLQDNS